MKNQTQLKKVTQQLQAKGRGAPSGKPSSPDARGRPQKELKAMQELQGGEKKKAKVASYGKLVSDQEKVRYQKEIKELRGQLSVCQKQEIRKAIYERTQMETEATQLQAQKKMVALSGRLSSEADTGRSQKEMEEVQEELFAQKEEIKKLLDAKTQLKKEVKKLQAEKKRVIEQMNNEVKRLQAKITSSSKQASEQRKRGSPKEIKELKVKLQVYKVRGGRLPKEMLQVKKKLT